MIYLLCQWYVAVDDGEEDEFLDFVKAYYNKSEADAEAGMWSALEPNSRYVFRVTPIQLV